MLDTVGVVKVRRPLALYLVEGFLEAGRYRLPDSGLQGFTAVTAHGKGCRILSSLGVRRARVDLMLSFDQWILSSSLSEVTGQRDAGCLENCGPAPQMIPPEAGRLFKRECRCPL